jgi:hypothetical protein
MDAIGSQVYGNFRITDQKGAGGKTYFKADLLNADGSVKSSPAMDIGYSGASIDCKGVLYVDTPPFPF